MLYLRARMPAKRFTTAEQAAIVAFVKQGGSLLVVTDEDNGQNVMEATGINDLLKPFNMRLTPDTEYEHNCGAIAKAGEINAADREVPYSGGRAVEGGTPFAFRINKAGQPAEAFAAGKKWTKDESW